ARNSQAPLSNVSFFEGNLAIHSSLFSSRIFALGRAPPKEEPGAIKIANQSFISSLFSSFSKRSAAFCSSRMEDQGGVGVWLLSSKNGPSGCILKRSAPIRLSSYTPSK